MKKILSIVVSLAVAVAILKLLEARDRSLGRKYGDMHERARSAAAGHDPRDVFGESVDEAIGAAAAEPAGPAAGNGHAQADPADSA